MEDGNSFYVCKTCFAIKVKELSSPSDRLGLFSPNPQEQQQHQQQQQQQQHQQQQQQHNQGNDLKNNCVGMYIYHIYR